MSVRERLALLFVLLAALAMPAAASADVTVSLSANVLRIQGDDEANMIFETSYDDTTPWFTTPAGTTLVAGPGCRQLESAGVECAGVGAATRAQIDLGAGDDLFLWNNTTVPMTIAGGDGDDDLSGSQGRDRIDGGAGNDSLVGFGGDDTIDGGDGNDLLLGGTAGEDRIDGGPGDDTIYTGSALDDVSCGDGRDIVYVSSEGEGDETTGCEVIVLGDPTDELNDNGDPELLRGRDNLALAPPVDPMGRVSNAGLMRGGAERAAQASPASTLRRDQEKGTDGDDRLSGTGGVDTLLGWAGNDTLLAGDGNDFSDGGKGNDRLMGGWGDDHLMGGFGDDYVDGGPGNDNVLGGRGSDRVYGGPGADFVNGGYGSDHVYGGGGDDRIRAVGGGADVISCGPGYDKVVKDRADRVSGDCEVVNGKRH